MANDSQEIYSLLNDEDLDTNFTQFQKAQWEYIVDSNNGNYTTQISYNLKDLKEKWYVPKDMYIDMNLTVPGNAGNYNASSIIALKNAVTDLISSCYIATTSGKTLVNDQSIQFINAIRLLVENNLDFYNSEGSLLQLAKNTNANDVNEFVSVPLAGGISAAGFTVPTPVGAVNAVQGAFALGLLAARNPLFNPGMNTRMIALFQQSSIVANNIQAQVYIPVKYIHDWFMQMDFPLHGLGFLFNFGVSWRSSNNIYPPFLVGGTTSIPNYTTAGITTGTQTRLWYRSITPTASVLKIMESKFKSGAQKKIKFLTSQFYPFPTITSGQISQIITPAAINPKRIWVLSVAANGFISSNTAALSTEALTGVQLSVNSTNFYENQLSTNMQQFEILKEQFPHGSSSILSYGDFLNDNRLLCLDVSRLKERVKNPNEAVSLNFSANKVVNRDTDHIYIVESEQVITIDFSHNNVDINIGPN